MLKRDHWGLILFVTAIFAACDNTPVPPATVGDEMSAPANIDANEVNASELPLPGGADTNVWKALQYRDAAGANLLVFRRQASSSDDDDDGYLEQVNLSVSHYLASDAGEGGDYQELWKTSEAFDCPGLDFEAGFLEHAIRIEDLDGDGLAEFVIGYSTFCAGGLEPHDITLILHARNHDYLLHGQSLIQPPGDTPEFGGGYTTTPPPEEIPKPLFEALIHAWTRVRLEGHSTQYMQDDAG